MGLYCKVRKWNSMLKHLWEVALNHGVAWLDTEHECQATIKAYGFKRGIALRIRRGSGG